MCGFEIRRKGKELQIEADIRGLPLEVVRSAGFLIDLETPLPGSNPATPNDGVIRRDLAPDCNTTFLVAQLGELGIYSTAVA